MDCKSSFQFREVGQFPLIRLSRTDLRTRRFPLFQVSLGTFGGQGEMLGSGPAKRELIATTTSLATARRIQNVNLRLAKARRMTWAQRAILQNQTLHRTCSANLSTCRVNALVPRASNTLGDADMSHSFKSGDSVRLLGLPEWLLHDLPKDEQAELLSYIGTVMQVQDIDSHGYVWVGQGSTSEHVDHSSYSGHSFGVPPEFLGLPP
jgi:hypothetical protein